MNVTLEEVKKALNIEGDYQDAALQMWFDETVDYIKTAGVKESNITVGIVARGVADLWNYGSGNSNLSAYFKNRVTQLTYKG